MKLKSKIKIRCRWILSIACLLAPAVFADTPAFTFGFTATNQPPSFTGTKGFYFINYGVSNYMAITQLGVFDNGGDGLVNSHAIGLWSVTGTLLASTTIPAGNVAPLVDGYRYMPITSVLIPPGNGASNIAVIAAAYSAGDADDMVTPFAAFNGLAAGVGLATPGPFSHGFFGLGTGLPFPDHGRSAPEGEVGAPFWEVNFQFATVVPEPSVTLLLAPGLLYLFFRQRKLR